MIKKMQNRYKEIQMLHIGLGSNFWHPFDLVYVLTGKVYY